MPELIKSRGCVVLVSSALGSVPVPEMGAYCAAKAALEMVSIHGVIEWDHAS
jgi:short-subunit dehydrogenase